jgi:hypothetical protein
MQLKKKISCKIDCNYFLITNCSYKLTFFTSGMSLYVHWITSSGAKLIHYHWNIWVREPIETTSIEINLH